MVFRDLPPEIQSHILELCSPSELAVLSRVHTSGQDLVESAPYSHIQYRVRPSDLIIQSYDENDEISQELKEDTLANNSRKASMVKMFYVGQTCRSTCKDVQLGGFAYSTWSDG